MLKKTVLLLALMGLAFASVAQKKVRPDAFPPAEEEGARKAVEMAQTRAEMTSWNRYPTYPLYVSMMQQWAADYPQLCRLDTIGTSINGRLILSLELTSRQADSTLPEFFYSSSIHGDELTGYILMLRLIDTLLSGYGTDARQTALMDSVRICINPLANPDGAYRGGNSSVRYAMRYNANFIDLNRNFPNPFGTSQSSLQPENSAMLDYVGRHRFLVSANLHGGSEVMNYPWDSFTSAQRPHPDSAWWKAVGKRFVDTCRAVDASLFTDVNDEGVIAGGDWYVITGGRQDYMNYTLNCREMTMEVSTTKLLSSDLLPHYWDAMHHALLNYIGEVLSLQGNTAGLVRAEAAERLLLRPNPAVETVELSGVERGAEVEIIDAGGRCVLRQRAEGESVRVDVRSLSAGMYTLRAGTKQGKLLVR